MIVIKIAGIDRSSKPDDVYITKEAIQRLPLLRRMVVTSTVKELGGSNGGGNRIGTSLSRQVVRHGHEVRSIVDGGWRTF